MILLDVTHTSHCRAHTGVQRVCRSLHAEVLRTGAGESVCYDFYEKAWRRLNPKEKEWILLDYHRVPTTKRGSVWSMRKRLEGYTRFLTGLDTRQRLWETGRYTGLVVPEIFHPDEAVAFPDLFELVAGPKVAVFHDAFALTRPEFSPEKTRRRFPGYLEELLRFDGVAAVSEHSRDVLLECWERIGAKRYPEVIALPLGTDFKHLKHPAGEDSQGEADSGSPIILMVSTIEGRKNHLALLEAAERLWSSGANFRLKLVGGCNRDTGAAALERIAALRAAGRSLEWTGPMSEEDLHRAYRECYFSVFPSHEEGYGLPVEESLQFGKPVVSTDRGALRERVRGGGCLVVEEPTAGAIADRMGLLLEDRALYQTLCREAGGRPFRTWRTYYSELQEWMQTLAGSQGMSATAGS